MPCKCRDQSRSIRIPCKCSPSCKCRGCSRESRCRICGLPSSAERLLCPNLDPSRVCSCFLNDSQVSYERMFRNRDDVKIVDWLPVFDSRCRSDLNPLVSAMMKSDYNQLRFSLTRVCSSYDPLPVNLVGNLSTSVNSFSGNASPNYNVIPTELTNGFPSSDPNVPISIQDGVFYQQPIMIETQVLLGDQFLNTNLNCGIHCALLPDASTAPDLYSEVNQQEHPFLGRAHDSPNPELNCRPCTPSHQQNYQDPQNAEDNLEYLNPESRENSLSDEDRAEFYNYQRQISSLVEQIHEETEHEDFHPLTSTLENTQEYVGRWLSGISLPQNDVRT